MSKAVELKLGGTLKIFMSEIEDVPEGSVIVTLTYDRFTITMEGTQMAYTLPADKQVQVQVRYVDANGNPATVDGDVEWESSDDSIATVTVDPGDSSIAMVVPGADIGQVQIIATADADLGAGVRELITTMDVSIVGGEAVAGTITPVGEPIDKPAERSKRGK